LTVQLFLTAYYAYFRLKETRTMATHFFAVLLFIFCSKMPCHFPTKIKILNGNYVTVSAEYVFICHFCVENNRNKIRLVSVT